MKFLNGVDRIVTDRKLIHCLNNYIRKIGTYLKSFLFKIEDYQY